MKHDKITVARPCDKTFECCRDLHQNELRFGGLSHIESGFRIVDAASRSSSSRCPLVFGNRICGANQPTQNELRLWELLKDERGRYEKTKKELQVYKVAMNGEFFEGAD